MLRNLPRTRTALCRAQIMFHAIHMEKIQSLSLRLPPDTCDGANIHCMPRKNLWAGSFDRLCETWGWSKTWNRSGNSLVAYVRHAITRHQLAWYTTHTCSRRDVLAARSSSRPPEAFANVSSQSRQMPWLRNVVGKPIGLPAISASWVIHIFYKWLRKCQKQAHTRTWTHVNIWTHAKIRLHKKI